MSAAIGPRGAQIHEQGYRRYEGVRLGSRNAIRAVFLHTLRFILGYKRKARSKIIPVGVIAVATLPALGFSAALLVIPAFAAELAQELLPGPESYLGGTALLTYIGAAMAGPAALCGDRLHGSLALYLASPLTRRTYLAGKAAAVFVFLSAVTVIPSTVYVLGIALSGAQNQSVQAVATDLFQVAAAGMFLALGYTVLSMAAASVTDRQGAASGLIVGFAVVSGIVGDILVLGLSLSPVLGLLNVNQALTSATQAIHVADGSIGAFPALLGSAIWIAALGGFVVWRYEKLQVTR